MRHVVALALAIGLGACGRTDLEDARASRTPTNGSGGARPEPTGGAAGGPTGGAAGSPTGGAGGSPVDAGVDHGCGLCIESSWGPAAQLQNDGRYGLNPVAALDRRGDALAAWIENGTPRTAWSNRFEVAIGAWGKAVLMPSDMGPNDARVVLDDFGDAKATLMPDNGFATSSFDRAGGGWTPARSFESPPRAWGVAPAPSASGRLFGAWAENPNIGGAPYRVWAAHHDGAAGWEAPQRLDANVSGSVGDGPLLVTSPLGNAIAVWRQSDSPALWTTRFAATSGGWAPPSSIAVGQWGFATSYAAAIDDGGDAIVTWSEVRASGGYNVFTSRYASAAGSWSPPEQFNGGNNPHVAMSGSGNAVLVWQVGQSTTSNLWWSHAARPGDPWSMPEAIGRDATVEMFDVAVNDAGVTLVVWTERPSGGVGAVPRILAARFE